MNPRTIALSLLLTSLPGLGEARPTTARVSMQAARETALQRVPGKIQKEELEREGGKLIYSFDILDLERRLMEVHVDAMTGAVLRVEVERPAPGEKKPRAPRK